MLRPGTFVRLRVPAGPPASVMLVDDKAIAADQSLNFVLVVDEQGMAGVRPVTIGGVHEGMRVIKTGLTVQDKVIINGSAGMARVRPGMPVNPQPAAPSAPAPMEKK
jgi:hypothetical protein